MKNARKIISLLIAISIISALLMSCSSGTVSGSANTIVFAQGAEPRGLDPALVDDGESSKIMGNIYEGLLKYGDDSTELKPSLAESWEVSDDGLTYTFNLRQGIKFHDGTDFNADAVKFNIDRQLEGNATEDMGYADFVYGSVKSVQVVDDHTVQVNMKEVCTPFLSNLAMTLAAPMVSPKALQENNNNVNENPVGTGPYKFVRWNKSESVVLIRNEEYWGNKAVTENLVFKFIADNSARVVALSNGEVDIIDGVDATVVDQIKNSGNILEETEGMNVNYMAYNTQSKLFSNKELRRAVSQAINVPELVSSLYQGYASEATSILPTFMNGYDESITQVKYDPDAAKETLSKAGVTKIHMITYSNSRPYNTANGQVLAEAIQGYLSKIGIECVIDSYDWTTYKEKVKAGDYDVCFYGWVGDNGDPDNFMNLLASDDIGLNAARYDNEEYKKLVEKGLSTAEGAERNKIYTQLEKMVAEDAVWLPISHTKILSARSTKIQNYNYHVTGNVFLSKVSKSQ